MSGGGAADFTIRKEWRTALVSCKRWKVARTGVDQERAKKIVKLLKDSKLKVQASIQGDAVRVSGAKRDDLQDAIALVRKSITDFPVQFGNFRD